MQYVTLGNMYVAKRDSATVLLKGLGKSIGKTVYSDRCVTYTRVYCMHWDYSISKYTSKERNLQNAW